MNQLYEQVNANNILSQFEKFKSSFSGNPKQIVEQLLNSGKMTQEQFNSLSQQATELQKLLGKGR